MSATEHNPQFQTLPGFLKPCFWDCDWEALSWEENPDFIIRRILQVGDWQSINWLRAQIGDQALREWLLTHRGGGLTPRQLRFWGLVLTLPSGLVTRWIRKSRSFPWEGRLAR